MKSIHNDFVSYYLYLAGGLHSPLLVLVMLALCVLPGCYITGCPRSGIKFLAVDHTVIKDCRIGGNAEQRIIIDKTSAVAGQANKSSEYNTVTDCQIYENGAYGIHLRFSNFNKSNNITLRSSSRLTSSVDGLLITTGDAKSATGNVVTGCVCTDDQPGKTQSYGIRITQNSRSVVDAVVGDNQLRENKTGSLSYGGASTKISNNAQ
jgi:parallel beta-helix repeat protein